MKNEKYLNEGQTYTRKYRKMMAKVDEINKRENVIEKCDDSMKLKHEGIQTTG